MGDKQLKEKLRNIIYEITINQGSPDLTNKPFSALIKQIDSLFMSSFTTMFIYNEIKEIYEMITSENDLLSPDIQVKVDRFLEGVNAKDIPLANDEDFIKLNNNEFDGHAYIIPIAPKYKPNVFILLTLREAAPAEVLHILARELGLYFNLYNYYNRKDRNERRNQFLYNFSTSLNSTKDIPTILAELIQTMQKEYPLFSSQLYLSQDYDLEEGFPVKPLQIEGSGANEMRTKAFISGEIQNKLNGKLNKSYLYAPLKGNQGIYGVIKITCQGGSCFPSDEIKFMENIANTAGKAMENAILYRHSKHLVADLKLLNDATQQLNSNVKFTELIKIVKKQIREACHASEVGFLFFNQEQINDLVKYDFTDGSTSYFYTEQGNKLTNLIINQMNGKAEPIFRGNMKEVMEELTHNSLMSFPMEQSGTVHGLIIILHKQEKYFTFEKFKLMGSLIQHATLALTNTILKDELEKAVVTDYLTQLYTRSFLDERITMHMEVDEKGTLLLFDIDDFKNINDVYGHHIGDKVIIQVADIIRDNLIIEDAVPTRWGGEELAVYLPQISMDEGHQVADNIRVQIEDLTHPQVTVSCGVSEWTENQKEEVIDVFLRADKALYAAKNLGKNSIVTDFGIER